ncbi:MAG: PilZ domain-containing protein [Nitrospirota bacterium]
MLKFGPQYSEKRLFCRIPITAELTYTKQGEKTLFKGICKNLSHSGIQFETRELLAEGAFLEITIDTKSDKFQPMNASIRVIRIDPLDNLGYNVSGIILEYK